MCIIYKVISLLKGSQRKNFVKSIFIVSFFVAVVYLPALSNRFVNWDDDVHLVLNPFIQIPASNTLQQIFTTTVNHTYIPLTTLSFSIEHYFYGNNPFVYHLNNVLLHILVTVLIIPIALQLNLTLMTGVVAALIFGLHPMHVESVAWVTERKDVLYALFYLTGVLTYLYYIPLVSLKSDGKKVFGFISKKYFLFVLVAAFGILSSLAKPMALSFPIILGLCDIYCQRPLRLIVFLEKIFIGFLLFPIGWLTFQGYMHSFQVDILTSILLWVWSFSFHLYKFFIMDYYVLIYKLSRLISLANPLYLLSVLSSVFLLIICIFNRKNRLFVFAVLYYLCSIFLILRWDCNKDLNMVADRFMYLPSLGICLWLGSIFTKMVSSQNEFYQRNKRIVIFAGCLLLVVLISKTHQQILVWKDSTHLWEHQLLYQPEAATALTFNLLAQAYTDEMGLIEKLQKTGMSNLVRAEQNQIQKVILLYKDSLKIKPDYIDSLFHLAQIYRAMGNWDQTEQLLLKIIKDDPKHLYAHLELGQIYLRRGEQSLALEQFNQAKSINSKNKVIMNSFFH